MNECFFMGEVIDVGEFKFILPAKPKQKQKLKSQITITVKVFDEKSSIFTFVAYNDTADYIFRNDFLHKNVLISAKLRTDKIDIYYIEEVK